MFNSSVSIILSNLTIGYDSHIVARNINETVRQCELTCLLGRNGCGKSTLLRTLAGFQPTIEGDIILSSSSSSSSSFSSSFSLSTLTPQERARQIGIVLTSRTDIENMSVRELVALGRAPYTGFWGKLGKEDEEVVEESLSQVGITDLTERMVHTLSDGERQKVMIAKALAQQTPIIFLDEPTAFLDYPSKVETMRLLSELCHEHGKTILLSTHDVEISLQKADRLWLMEKNKGITSFKMDGTVDFEAETLTVRRQ